jgi:hypothetical protein
MLHRMFLMATASLLIANLAIAEHGPIWGTWSGVHYIDGDCQVTTEYGDLTMLPGTEVRFMTDEENHHWQILVNGGATLEAQGTAQSPVLFTADEGTQAGTWKALIADGASGSPATMTLTNCEISYGGENQTSQSHVYGPVRLNMYSEVTISDCYIHDSYDAGVGTDHNGAGNNFLSLTGCRFERCDCGIKLIQPANYSEVLRNWIDTCGVGISIDTNHNMTHPCKVQNNIILNSDENGAEDNGEIADFKNNLVGWSGANGLEGGDLIDYAIENNIFIGNGRYGLIATIGNVQTNCYYGNTSGAYSGVTEHSPVTSDPLFVSGFGDYNYYHLLWNSPCLGAGDDELTNSNPAISCSMP